MCIKKLLSKSDLCRIYGYYSRRSGKCYTHRLREKVLTDEVLHRVGIDPNEYAKIRIFTALQTQRLIRELKIEKNEMEDLELPSA